MIYTDTDNFVKTDVLSTIKKEKKKKQKKLPFV